MRKAVFVTLFAICSSHVFGALAPFFQSNREYVALLQDRVVQSKFSPYQQIKSIKRKGNTFTLKTKDCSLKVKLVYVERDGRRAGPKPFKFVVGGLVCP